MLPTAAIHGRQARLAGMAEGLLAGGRRASNRECVDQERGGVPPGLESDAGAGEESQDGLVCADPRRHRAEHLREAMLAADHNAYHVGQLILLRRLLGAWKGD
jgi:hypothetical protein